MSEAEQEKAFADAMRDLMDAHPTFSVELDWFTAIAILGNLQFALRHPLNRGDTAERTRRFIDMTIARIEEAEPKMGPFLRMGDNPQHDRRST